MSHLQHRPFQLNHCIQLLHCHKWSTTMSGKMGITEDVPLYDSAEDEPFLVISGTSGGNEHTKILNDSEGSTFKLEPSNSTSKNYNIGSGSTTKQKPQRKPKLKRLKMADPAWNYGKKLSETNRTRVICRFCGSY